jgi:hypothetical protein
MADDNALFDPLESLGSEYGTMNRPEADTKSFLPNEGEITPDHKINFPDEKFFPVLPKAENLNRPNAQVRQLVTSKATKQPLKNQTPQEKFDALMNKVQAKANAGQSKDEYAKIYAYDAGPSGNAFYKRYAAYGQEKFDEVGFHPFRDNESAFNAKTTGWDDFSRMATNSFAPLFTRGFVSGPKSIIKMLNGDFSADTEDARIYEEAAAIGQSSKKGIGAFMNNAAMNFSYSAGIMVEAIAEEMAGALLAPLTGGASFFASSANLLKNSTKAIKGLNTAVDGAKAIAQSLKAVDNVNDAKTFWNSVKAGSQTKFGKFINPFENVAETVANMSKNPTNLTGLAKSTQNMFKTAGAFYRDVRNINMSLAEARLEGGFVQNKVYDTLYNDYFKKFNKAPSDELQADITRQSKIAASDAIKWNTMLIYGSNKLVMPNILAPKGGIAGSLAGRMKDVLDLKTSKVVFEKAKKAVKDVTDKASLGIKGEFKDIPVNFKNTLLAFQKQALPKAIKGAGVYLKGNLAEGIQENLQEVIAGATEKYYVDTYRNKAVGEHLFNKGLSGYAMDELKGQYSAQGFETFASGFVMGMFAAPLNRVIPAGQLVYNRMFNKEEYQKYKDIRTNYAKNVKTKLNALYSNPDVFFNSRLTNYAVQERTSSLLDDADTKLKRDATDAALFEQIKTAIDSNSLDYFIDHLSSMKDNTPEMFEEAFGFEKGTGQKYMSKIDSIIEKVKTIESDYKQIDERFPNPINLEDYDEKDPEYVKASILHKAWQSAKDAAVFSNHTFKDVMKRMSDIMETVTSEESLKKISNSDLQLIFNPSKLNNEIGILKTEVESLKSSVDPQSKKQLEFKKAKLDSLQNFLNAQTNHSTFNNRNNFIAQAKINIAKSLNKDISEVTNEEVEEYLDDQIGPNTNDQKIKVDNEFEKAYKDYLKVLAKESNEILFNRDIDTSFEKLLDFYKLDNESKIFAEHINVLHDPANFLEQVERNQEWMTKLYQNRKIYFDEIVENSIKNTENNALLNALANENIYISLDDFQKFIETGVYPEEFFDNTNKKVITSNNPSYIKYINFFRQLSELQSRLDDSSGNLDVKLQNTLNELDEKMQLEIDALDKVETRNNIAFLESINNQPITIKQILKDAQDQEYVEAVFGENNQTITYFKDGEDLKFDDVEGDVVNIKDTDVDFKTAVRFNYTMKADPEQVAQIENKYKELKDQAIEEYNSEKETLTEDSFVPITVNTPYESLPKDLKELLSNAFNESIAEDEVALNATPEQQMNLFEQFIATDEIAKDIIDNYNKRSQLEFATQETGEQEEFKFKLNGKEINSEDLKTLPQIRVYINEFESLINDINKKPKTELTLSDNQKKAGYSVVIKKLEKLIKTRAAGNLTPEAQQLKQELELLLKRQQYISKTPNGYIINNILHRRVTNVVKDLKTNEYNYNDIQVIKDAFDKIIGKNTLTPSLVNSFISELRTKSPKGFSEFTYNEISSELLDTLLEAPLESEELFDLISDLTIEKTYEAARIAGTYLDKQVRNLFENKTIEFDETKISEEAFNNLFGQDGYLTKIKERTDSGELSILASGLIVYDEDLQIAGEVDLLVIDSKGKLSIIDVKTGDKDKWDNFNGTGSFAEGKREDYELQQTAYANLLYKMTGIKVNVGLLPIQITKDSETGKVETAKKPGPEVLKPGKFTIPLNMANVQERVNTIIPIDTVLDEKGLKVATALSDAAITKLNKLGFSNEIISVMSTEDIELAKTFTSTDDATELLNKYTTSDIEAKRADIEKRRQEELNKPRGEFVSKTEFNIGDEVYSLYGSNNTEYALSTPKRGIVQSIIKGKEGIANKDRVTVLFDGNIKSTQLNEEVTSRLLEKSDKAINVKYDAELTALEQQSNNINQSTDDEASPAESPIADEVVSTLSIPKGITADEVKAKLNNIGTVEDLKVYRADLNIAVQQELISKNDIPLIKALLNAKEESFKNPDNLSVSTINLKKGDELIVKDTIFTKNKEFAEVGASIIVKSVNNTKNSVIFIYNGKTKTLSFDDVKKYTTSMDILNTQVNTPTETLTDTDKDKVVISNDLVEVFKNTPDSVNELMNGFESFNTEDLEEDLLNNLDC